MDAKIVGPYEVGLTEKIRPWCNVIKRHERIFKQHWFFSSKENMGVYNQLNSKGSFNGGGMALDRELLYNEQSKIQDFMFSLDIKDLDKYLGEYKNVSSFFVPSLRSAHRFAARFFLFPISGFQKFFTQPDWLQLTTKCG